MPKPRPIAFDAELRAPMPGKAWTFVTLPPAASARLGTRGRIAVEGTINGHRFRTSAFPDGKGSHQLMVNAEMRRGAGAEQGHVAHFALRAADDEVVVEVPEDLRKALAKRKAAQAQFQAITAKARAEWVRWITTAKRTETRKRRVTTAAERLARGVRRPTE